MKPAISVILYTYGGRVRRSFVSAALKSLSGQTLDRDLFETIVVSDTPLPAAGDLLKDIGAKLLHNTSGHMGKMVIEALNIARGDVICFLDDDDEFEPNRLSRVYCLLSRVDGPVLYYNQRVLIDELGRRITHEKLKFLEGELQEGMRVIPPGSVKHITDHSYFNSSSIAISRHIASGHLDVLGRLQNGLDMFMLTAAISDSATFLLDSEKLTRYRLHRAQLSTHLAGTRAKERVDGTNSKLRRYIVSWSTCLPLVKGSSMHLILEKDIKRMCVTNHLYYSGRREVRDLCAYYGRYFTSRGTGDYSDMLMISALCICFLIHPSLPSRIEAIANHRSRSPATGFASHL